MKILYSLEVHPMKIPRVLLAILALSVVNVAYAEKPIFYGAELIVAEDAIEAVRVTPVVTPDNIVIEVRVFECESCAVKTYPPAKNIEFFSGKNMIGASTAATIAKNAEAVVFIDIATQKVRSVKYRVKSANGESL